MPTTTALRLLLRQLESSICYHFKHRSDPRFASQIRPLAGKVRQVRGLIRSRDNREAAQINVGNLQVTT
jgi:hypothetical protein